MELILKITWDAFAVFGIVAALAIISMIIDTARMKRASKRVAVEEEIKSLRIEYDNLREKGFRHDRQLFELQWRSEDLRQRCDPAYYSTQKRGK